MLLTAILFYVWNDISHFSLQKVFDIPAFFFAEFVQQTKTEKVKV